MGDSAGVEVAVYDITSGTDGATLVPGTSQVISGSLTASSWNTASLATPVALTSGNDYAVAFRIVSATGVAVVYDYTTFGTSESDLDGSSAMDDPWTDNASNGFEVSFYAQTTITSGSIAPLAVHHMNQMRS